jgi:hypothetical protein
MTQAFAGVAHIRRRAMSMKTCAAGLSGWETTTGFP